jgi:methylenetetrahydrofolate dehydrogenase (NADP+)/methenyltetrahydrofolate cyclohydrolase
MVGAEHVRPGAVVVDVGIHRRPEGGLCGDVRFDEVEPIARAISPVPGGVGPMTVAMLLVNTVVSWASRHGLVHGLDDLLP